ncbi:dihydrodipicolinate synthase family protein [Aestuariibaculum suncheonense]|uniref:Dihydrodipicolinate synthase family protein n=1 Tax=Aestuariibaculum suncheonense TaxID=1028745 RepID=A0A8J6QFI5_9FLAO|nr:dihydrodipicolinate synthase family protein [Aestuariibaculum suncheonense]MBD0835257.1 dihydrodipicolinate synthase family protein [Aestuariibaculum suncheonense]
MKIENLIAATYAPMHQDGSLNTGVIKDYAQFLINNKVSGVFMNGSTGDFVSLSTEERKALTLAWSENKSSDLYLIDHVGDPSLKVSKELATYASDKVDAIAVLAPYYFRLNSIDKLVQYCKEVAACAPKLPFYYYHIPVLSGANLNMIEFLKIAPREIPTFAGIKFTNNNLIDYLHSKNFEDGKYNILFGFDEIFLSSLPLGAKGWVGSTYNHIPSLYYKIKELFEAGQMQKAAQLQTKAIRFVEILDSKGGFNGVAKGFMKTYGIDCGPSRFPHSNVSNEVYDDIKKELEKIGLSEFLGK